MTELEIPPEADEERAGELVREFVDVGDVVEVWNEERTGTADERIKTRGTVTGFEADYVELDGEPLDGKSVRYEEIFTMERIASS